MGCGKAGLILRPMGGCLYIRPPLLMEVGMAKAKPKASPEASWLRFLAALDGDAKTGGIVRGWVNAGCDLRRIFTYAAGPANPHVARRLSDDMKAKQTRGAGYKRGARKAKAGLDAAAAALGDAPELAAVRCEAAAMAAAMEQRLENAKEAFELKRWGSSQDVDAYTLAALRAFTGASIIEVVRVAEAAAKAHRPGVSFRIEAAEKALRRFEARNPRMVATLKATAGGSR